MALLFLLGLLSGVLLGGRFRVFAVIPVQLMALAFFAVGIGLAGWPWGWSAWAFCAWSVALQGGYIVGLVTMPRLNGHPKVLTSNF